MAEHAQLTSYRSDQRAAESDLQAAEVREYLLRTPRQLPARYFYDALGSALFEAICRLPWYAVARVESSLLGAHAGEILPRGRRFASLVELGSGSGAKLAGLLQAAGSHVHDTAIHLVDVSPSALEEARRAVTAAGAWRITTYERPYEEGLRAALSQDGRERTLVLFLGSNIGNFDPPAAAAFLRVAREAMSEGDGLLLGADLLKPEADLLLAYDDPLGVTAAFNRNLLHRLNRELGADFRVDRFAHRAVWNARESRVEMHLVSLDQCVVRVRGADLTFTLAEGETIWTESSYKYDARDLIARVESAGFEVTRQWVDERRQFALTLAEAGKRPDQPLRRIGTRAER